MFRIGIRLNHNGIMTLMPQLHALKCPKNMAPSFFLHAKAFRDADDDDKLPRITCPKKLKEQYYHRQKKQQSRRQNRGPRGPLVISCKRKGYNSYARDKFDQFNLQKLVSCGWKNSKRVGDYFTIVPHSKNPCMQNDDEILSFQDLGINDSLCAGLQNLGFEKPTMIQKRSIPSLLRGENAICAAETGSGKTLAYLLPAVEWILRQKHASEHNHEHSFVPNVMRPNTVIISPNRELAHQIMNVAEMLKPYADFVPHCLTGGQSYVKPTTPIDMLVTTPGTLIRQISTKRIHGSNLQHMVIDESDTLLDDSFISDLQKIFSLFKVNLVEFADSKIPYLGGTQVILFSATMPKNIGNALGNILPVDSMTRITTTGLHKLQPHVSQKFIRIKASEKPEKLIQLVKEKQMTTLIFTKNNETNYFIAKTLQENGVNCLRLSGEMSPENRAGVFSKFKEGYSDILVATDIISRGLDTTNVQHVINYDFPSFMSDYIHRVGRVGRMGVKETGQVTSFITHKWEVDMLWKIEAAARSNKKLDSVNANIKMQLQNSKLPDSL